MKKFFVCFLLVLLCGFGATAQITIPVGTTVISVGTTPINVVAGTSSQGNVSTIEIWQSKGTLNLFTVIPAGGSSTLIPAGGHYVFTPTGGYAPGAVAGTVALTTGIGQFSIFQAVNIPGLTPSGGGGSSTSVGPVINVTSMGASPALADNAVPFAAVASAANAAAYVSVGVPTIRSTGKTVTALGILTATQAVSISAGDTVLVGILAAAPTGITFTVSDGVNVYYPISIMASPAANNNEAVQIFGTVPGLAKAFSGTLTVTASGSANFGFIVLDAYNVGSYSQVNVIQSNAGTGTPSVTVQTQDANNIIASWVDYFSSGTITMSAVTGTLQQTFSGPTNAGGGLITNSSAAFNTAVTTAGLLSSGTPWVMNGLELRSVKPSVPTIYFPVGYYAYSSGLSFTNPVTLKGEPGSVLCYIGTADAVDMGPTGLLIAQGDAYTVDGLRFECGEGMTNGIVFASNAILTEVKNSHFYNFGNLTSSAIYSNGNTQDLSVKNNHFTIWESGAPTLNGGVYNAPARTFVNLTTSAAFSTLTMTNNYAFCASGRVNGGVGCGTYLAAFIKLSGYAAIISNNSFAGGFCPWVQLGGTTSAYGTKIQDNDFETDTTGCYAITYRTGQNDGLKVLNNYWNDKGSGTEALLGPADGTELLTNAEVSGNIISNHPVNVAIVAQNNLTGQTGNIGWHNTCSTGGGSGTTPCPILHTAGGSINQWNNDYAGTCTMVSGVCPTYNFLGVYNPAPKCTASWTGAGTLTAALGGVTVTTAVGTPDTLIISSKVLTDTAVMNWSCSPEAQ
jgi:hypothetical protein